MVVRPAEGYSIVCRPINPNLSPGMKTPEEVHKKTSCNLQLASLNPVNVFKDGTYPPFLGSRRGVPWTIREKIPRKYFPHRW